MPCENIVITIEETNEIIEIIVNDFTVSNILSSDDGNSAELGTDGKVFVPTPAAGIQNHSELNLDDGTNPHGTTKSDVGLGDVPNLDTTSAVNNEHTHSNKTILDNTEQSFTTALKIAYDNVVNWVSANGTNLLNHLTNFSNPHGVTKSQIGLGNVDNTSDASKPISTAQQTALNLKQDVLVSGTNIKTINGSSVLGSGNLVVGGSSDEFLKHKVKWTTLYLNNNNWKAPIPFDPTYYDTSFIGSFGNASTPVEGGGGNWASWDSIPDGYYVYGVQLEINYRPDILSLASSNLQVYINRVETNIADSSNTMSNVSNLVNQVVNVPLGVNGRMNFIFPLTVASLSPISLAKSFTKIWVREITSTNIYYSVNFDIIYKKL